jgi:protein-tyrosine phosphatase
VPGRLCAGEYPGAPFDAAARAKLALLRDAGITFFLDHTQERDGLEPYAHLLEANGEQPIAYRRFPIRDMDIPTPQTMRQILDAIDAALAAGECVYVHCWGGIGRTGTVVGCWMVEHGRSGQGALTEIERLRVGIPDEWRASPETSAQRRMVLTWPTLSSIPHQGAGRG